MKSRIKTRKENNFLFSCFVFCVMKSKFVSNLGFLLFLFLCYYLELLQNSQSFPLLEKMMRATSASQSTESSYAFLRRPFLLLAKVTCLLILFSILFNSTLPLPIFSGKMKKRTKGKASSFLSNQTTTNTKCKTDFSSPLNSTQLNSNTLFPVSLFMYTPILRKRLQKQIKLLLFFSIIIIILVF